MSRTLQDLVTAVRALIQEPTADKWTDAEIARHCSREQRNIARELINFDETLFKTYADITLTANTTYYTLPSNFQRFTAALLVKDGLYYPIEWTTDRELWYMNYNTPLSRQVPYGNASVGLFLHGNQLGVVPYLTTSGGTLEIFYNRILPNLQYGTAQVNTTKTQIILASSPTVGETTAKDDELNGAEVYIVSGTDAGETRTITDYVHSTRVATVSPAFTAAPTNDSIYSLLTEIPLEWESMIEYGAARACLAKSGDKDLRELMNDEWTRVHQMMIEYVGSRQIQQPSATSVTAAALERGT